MRVLSFSLLLHLRHRCVRCVLSRRLFHLFAAALSVPTIPSATAAIILLMQRERRRLCHIRTRLIALAAFAPSHHHGGWCVHLAATFISLFPAWRFTATLLNRQVRCCPLFAPTTTAGTGGFVLRPIFITPSLPFGSACSVTHGDVSTLHFSRFLRSVVVDRSRIRFAWHLTFYLPSAFCAVLSIFFLCGRLERYYYRLLRDLSHVV